MGNYIELVVTDITVNLSNVVMQNSILKRKASLVAMIYNQRAKTVSVGLHVSYYEQGENDEYGALITAPGISPYEVEVVASNETMVNVITGDIVIKDEEGNYPVDYTGQYDFLNSMFENSPIILHDEIQKLGLQALSKM